MPKPKIISGKDLNIEKKLGNGFFGVVKKASWRPAAKKATLFVALKFFFRDGYDQEVLVMSNLKHKNVVKLVGVSKVAGDSCLVMELMNGGSLQSFVKKNKKEIQVNIAIIKGLLSDVATGMRYISNKGYVHRDLAARNVLVHHDVTKKTYIAKIADFGLTRDETYYISSYGLNAFCWMPPEVYQERGFSPASDVWSFGILAWETFTFGREPFSGLRPHQVKVILMSKKVPLTRPRNCSIDMFEVIKKCWAFEPEDRVTFSKLVVELKRIKL